jgi:hypothetical protein
MEDTMAEDIKQAQETEETPEVEAHSAEVLGLQGISVPGEEADGVVAMSCTSCVGSIC